MPPDWASSGARLALSFDVRFDERELELFGSSERWLQRLPSEPDADIARYKLSPVNHPKYVNEYGEQTVALQDLGAWCESGEDASKKALRFFVDFADGAGRQDASLQAERVFFETTFWPAGVLQTLQQARDELAKKSEEVCQRRDAHKQATEQADALRKLLMVRQGVLLYDEQILVDSKLAEVKRCLPDERGTVEASRASPSGRGPSISLSNGGTLSVKRKARLTNAGEEYHVIGTFSARPCAHN